MLPMGPVQAKCWKSRSQQHGSSPWSDGIVPSAGAGGRAAPQKVLVRGGVTLSDVSRQPARVKRRPTQRWNALKSRNAKNGCFKSLSSVLSPFWVGTNSSCGRVVLSLGAGGSLSLSAGRISPAAVRHHQIGFKFDRAGASAPPCPSQLLW